MPRKLRVHHAVNVLQTARVLTHQSRGQRLNPRADTGAVGRQIGVPPRATLAPAA